MIRQRPQEQFDGSASHGEEVVECVRRKTDGTLTDRRQFLEFIQSLVQLRTGSDDGRHNLFIRYRH